MHAQLMPDFPLYNEPVTIHYAGDLDPAALECAFNEILRRHEAWRTCFQIVDGHPQQIVLPELSVSLPVIDLRSLSERDRETAAVRIASSDARKPIDLARAPLFRTRLFRLADRQYRLYLALSHIIFDGIAIYRVFLPELAALYQAHVDCTPSPLRDPVIQYPDYSCWQRKSNAVPREHIEWWKRQLEGLPVLDLPSDRRRPPVQTFRGSMYAFRLDRTLTDAVRRACREEGVTIFQMLLASFTALLERYSGQDDFTIGSVTAGRDRPETAGLLGYFLNTVVLRMDASGDPSFRELVRRVRNVTLDVLEHDGVPFTTILREVNARPDLGRNPLFDVMFSLEPPLPQVDPAWQLTQMDIDTGATKYDLYLELDERRAEILARFHYSTDMFDPETVCRMSSQWMRLVAAAAADRGLRVSQLPLMSEDEKRQVLGDWNQTRAEIVPSRSIHQLFDSRCQQTPNAVALWEGEKSLSFGELQQQSNEMAHRLWEMGIRHGNRVALCADRSLGLIASLLGILKTGAAYVPVDPSYPPDRISFVLKDAEVSAVIAQEEIEARLHSSGVPILTLVDVPPNNARINDVRHGVGAESAENVCAEVSRDAAAYVIYTSGTSGRPKGVEGTHRGAVNRFGWMWERYPFEAGEVCCQKTNLSFVDSIWEIFGPLLAGVPSVILPQEVVLDPEEMLEHLARHGVTRIVLVPSLLRALLDHAPNLGERVPGLKLWTSSGEVLPAELGQRFRRACPEAKLLNIYGSSEVAADVTCHEVREEDRVTVPIGKPIHNTQVYVLDGERNAVPVGVRGEIYIGGEGLALGYWKRAELTGERFVENEIAPERSKRLYRTGDVGRWRGDGELEYVGRVDSEVKLRGMRIELGEIEAVLVGEGGVGAAAVEVEGGGGDEKLVAYVELREGERPTASELRRRLRKKLPEHMVPAGYVVVEELPKLASGKVNRRELAKVEGERLREQGKQPARSEAERKLVEIWQELLKVEEVGVEENFFELGGHSLLGLQVVARVRRRFEVELPVRAVFEEPTIAGLARAIEKAEAEGLKTPMPVLKSRAQSSPPAINRAALLAELGSLPTNDLQKLLDNALDEKHAEATGGK